MHAHPRPLRPSNPAGPLLLYLPIALAMLWPYRLPAFRFSGDLWVVISGIAEARNGLAEGQFPLRVAPDLDGGARYPLFQYYGNLPYSLSGAVCLISGCNAYSAWKLVTLLSLTAGGYFAFRLAYAMTRRSIPAALAGTIFLLAPYQFTDMNARGAFAECVAFNLLPATFYFLFRTLSSPRLRYIVLCAVAWSLLGFSHNIAYACAVLFAVPFCLCFVGRRRRKRFLRLAAVAVLHAALVVWYFVPQLMTLGHLNIREESGSPYEFTDVAPLRVLLSPVLTNTPRGESWPGLAMQVGWPIVAAALLVVVLRAAGRRDPRRLAGRFLALLFVSFLIVWSPVDFWRYLPRVLWVVQFPYRLLMFVVLWGSVLAACALAAAFPRRMPRAALMVVLFLIGLSAASYLPPRTTLMPDRVKGLTEHPDMGQTVGTAYLLSPPTVATSSLAPADAESTDWAAVSAELRSTPQQTILAPPDSQVRAGERVHYECSISRPALLALPVLYYPRLLDVRDNGRRVRYGNIGRFAAVRLRPGTHHVEIRYQGARWANVVSGIGWSASVPALVIALARSSKLRRRRSPHRPQSRGRFSVVDAVLGFALLAAGAGLALAHPVTRWIGRPPNLTITGGTRNSPEEGPESAFDGDDRTAWVASDSGPTSITVRPFPPARLGKITFRPRVTPLYEGWSHVRVVLWLEGRQVYARAVDFPDAAHRRSDSVRVPATLTDRIDLHFSQPVLERRDGGAPLMPQQVRPGYNEIELTWQR